MAPIDKDAKIACPTPQHLQAELDALSSTLALGEKEETWEKLERALIRFASVTKGGGYKHVALYVEGIGRKGMGLEICACMMSDRGRLSGVATELLQTLSPRLANSFAPLVTLYLGPLIRLLGRPNKVVLKRSEKCLSTIISHCHLPTIILELKKGLSEEAATCRRGCAKGIERAMTEWDREIWNEKAMQTVEEGIKKMATDKDPEVRQVGKRVWALFTDSWPERVEEFSGPLSPITRRYLDIASSNGPSKPAASARAMGPPPPAHRPISATSSVSSTSAPPPKPTHARTKSQASRSARAVDREPGPSKESAGPTASAPASAAPSPEKEEKPRPPISKSTSRPDMPKMGAAMRSVSHNVLPTYNAHAGPSSPAKTDNYPWTKAHRPLLPSSYSTVSLPVHPTDHTFGQPVRRFPPPSRGTRTPISEENDREHLFTPAKTTLGTAVRLVNPNPDPRIGHGRLGPAQRRVVTAPVLQVVSHQPSAAAAITAVRPPRSVKKRVEELEEEIKSISNPSSPVPSKSSFQHLSPSIATSPGRLATKAGHISPSPISLPTLRKAEVAADSPLLPVLMRSTNSIIEQQEREEDLRGMEEELANMTVMDMTVVQVAPVRIEARNAEEAELAGDVAERVDTVHNDAEQEGGTETHEEDTNGILSDRGERLATPTVIGQQDDPVEDQLNPIDVQHSSSSDLDDGPFDHLQNDAEAASSRDPQAVPSVAEDYFNSRPIEAAHVPLPHSPVKVDTDLPDVEEESACAAIPPAPFPPERPITKKLDPHPTGSTVRAQVTGTSARAEARANGPRKPPVPTARSARLPGGIDRKPFKPISHAGAAPAKATLSTSTSKKAEVTTQPIVAKPAPVAGPAKVKAVSAIPPKPPVPRVVSAKIATQPDVSKPVARPPISASLSSSTTAPKVAITKPNVKAAPTAHSSVTLPPIRKEKVRLKAPLPKFVPVRSKDRNGLSNSVTKSSEPTHAKAATGQTTVRAKVKPESIPLPMSPAEKAKLPPHDIPLPRSRPSSPSKYSLARTGSSSAADNAVSPLLTNPRVLSPVLTTDVADPSPPPTPPPTKLVDVSSPDEIPSPFLHAANRPAESDLFSSTAAKFDSTRTAAPMSDSETEDDLEGITTRLPLSHSLNGILVAKVRPQAERDLMEFSASSRPAHGERKDVSTPNKAAEMLLAKIAGMQGTPKASPGAWERKALSLRDVNRTGGESGEELE